MPFGRRLVILGLAAPFPALAQKDGGTLGTPGGSGGVAPPRQGPLRTGVTDADSGDSSGYGRRNVDRNRLPNRPHTGVTDADSSDSPGYGRRGVDPRRLPDRPRSGLTDADSGDSPGNGVGHVVDANPEHFRHNFASSCLSIRVPERRHSKQKVSA